ncbi:MAG: glutaredoxin family protein [Gammaproteobacteria bacterium]
MSATVVVYSRRGCHLCELLLEELGPLVRGIAEIQVRDVDERPEWRDAYGLRVPVLCCDGEEICQYNLDRRAVMDWIATHDQ